MAPHLAILLPTRNRPHLLERWFTAINESGIPVTYQVYAAVSDPESHRIAKQYGAVSIIGKWPTATDKVNLLTRNTTEPYLYISGDDLIHGHDWYQEPADLMARVNGIVPTPDGHWLASREYLNTLGGTIDGPPGQMLHPGYTHNFAETELFAVAEYRGRYIRARTPVNQHAHRGAGLAPDDDTYRRADAAWTHDEQLYWRRQPMWGKQPHPLQHRHPPLRGNHDGP